MKPSSRPAFGEIPADSDTWSAKVIAIRPGQYTEDVPTRPGFYVYRCWSADGTCLYVGCAGERGPKRVRARLSDHKRSKPWWPQVARVDVASFAGSDEVIAEEPRQIAALDPVHNKRLRPYCSKGHDLTLPGARYDQGACVQCHRIWSQKKEPKLRNREHVKRYRQTPEGQAHLVVYERSRAVRKLQQRKSRSRRPAPGQEPLW